ncbi:MAG: hypothetical protein HY040_09555 [Planctomycetes bacterium]|nr:hypothetical protein [Planctomycetota bacterium]
MADSIELTECLRYIDRAIDEQPFADWKPAGRLPALIIPEGFEERSLGILQSLARRGARLPRIVIGRYVKDVDINKKHRARFEELAEELAPRAWVVIENHDNGDWVRQALQAIPETAVALDITGLSSRAVFGALDALSCADAAATLMYSEAAHYWPSVEDWQDIERERSLDYRTATALADRADESDWLYSGRNFHVDLIEGHEGYDVAGTSALVAFLPFKAGRLAAVMSHAEYSEYVFIAGRPRLPANLWRLDALKRINGVATREWPVVEMSTFGYREALRQMAALLFGSDSISHRCDIHLAPMAARRDQFPPVRHVDANSTLRVARSGLIDRTDQS